ncbi:ATP-binding protein [Candidatus Woesearchaeota archaeon]|nr:ATP-binding protein [Candidatus Woesearchaeota archaeon]
MAKNSEKEANLQINHVSELLKIIEGGLQMDSSKVLNYSLLLIQKLEKNNDFENAQKIKNILKRTKSVSLSPKGLSLEYARIPVDTESRLPLAEVKNYFEDEVFLAFNEKLMEDIKEFILLLKEQDNLPSIKVYRNLLLYGPSGTGKTQTAKYISAKTGLPLVTVRIDGLVSSYLGSTSKNIRALFDFIEKTPCILFLDEFDAVAKMRDDANELGELKRVVNSLLQNIDGLLGKVPIIAATNHQHLLDPAVWRRFDYKMLIDYPNENEREHLVRKFLSDSKFNDNLYKIMSALTEKMSGAEIEVLSNMIKTKIVLEPNKRLDENRLLELFLRYNRRVIHFSKNKDGLEQDDGLILMKSLRKQNKNLFTIDILSKMFGMSTGKISTFLREEKNE